MQAPPASAASIPAAEAAQVVDGTPVTSPEGERAVATGHAETSTTQPAETGGLPQFRFEYWGGQIVWLVVLFALLYLVMSRVFTPRLRKVRDEREAAITGAIEEARRVRAEADAQSAAAHAEMSEARAKAQAAAADAKARANTEAGERQRAQEAELNVKLAEAEARIRTSRDAAMGSVRDVAADTASAIVERLTGRAAQPQEVEAALASTAA